MKNKYSMELVIDVKTSHVNMKNVHYYGKFSSNNVSCQLSDLFKAIKKL